jgi:hypothetical protein
MSDLDLTPTQERSHLIAQIARQRGELAEAYRNLAKPIQYVEGGMRGFAFLRANPWVLTVVPALVSITTSVVGVVRNKPPKTPLRQRQKLEREAGRETRGFAGHVAKWGGRGWKIFKLYRRVRKFLP